MRTRFELFVALRYLMAKRKQAVISVVTAISVAGVAAGVMALVIALAINAGFRNTLQRNLLVATAHVSVLEKVPEFGIEDWKDLSERLRAAPGVRDATASLYASAMFSGPLQSSGGALKGIPPPGPRLVPEVLAHLKAGRFAGWDPVRGLPPIILGSRLGRDIGIGVDDVVRVLNPMGEQTPHGPRLTEHRFRVIGLFETGFFDLDSRLAFCSLRDAQRVLAVADVVNTIELRLDDIYAAPQVAGDAEKIAGAKLGATTWMEQNQSLLGAFRLERIVTVITIGLIQMVAALNILISLVMMVMEKHRDIAILMSMGARREQISRLFQVQGVLIGVVGTAIGLAAGYSICYFANRGEWIALDESIYSMRFVPFEPRWTDGLWIAGAAMLISFLATIYPARSASRIAPAEALRYE